MFNRRTILVAGATLVAASTATSAFAQDWKAKYPELTFAIVPAENASGVTDRYTPFMAYLSKEIGIPVKLRVAQDYAAVIEGQRAGNIHIANYGSASFARARMTGVNTEVFATDVSGNGSKGYYSVFFVLAKSPFEKIQDLKGKNLGLVDPNSTSGNNIPRFVMDRQGINPDTFFSKVVYAGSHENAILALSQGQVEVAANQWTSETDSTLQQMLTKGMLKNADGSMMKKEDFRIIGKSDEISNGPFTYLADLPADLKTAIAKAFLDAPKKDKTAFDKLSDGQKPGFAPMTTKDYDSYIDLIKFVDSLRKKSS
jgi:phosphonate transport system substrate-binding protein